MGRPGKPMAKNSNSKFTTRNNKQDIFSKLAKSPRLKSELDKRTAEGSKSEVDKTDP